MRSALKSFSNRSDPPVFFLLRAHSAELLHGARWPGLARMLNLPVG